MSTDRFLPSLCVGLCGGLPALVAAKGQQKGNVDRGSGPVRDEDHYGDTLVAERPRVWSEKRLADGIGNFDLAPDGKRLAAVNACRARGSKTTQGHAILVLNLLDELRRRTALQTEP